MADETTETVDPSTTETTDPVTPPIVPIVPPIVVPPATPAPAGEAADVVDQNFEFALPTDTEIDKDSLAGFKAFSLEKKLTKENAQSVLDFMLGSRKKYDETQKTTNAETVAKNIESIKADPNIGGTNFEKVQNAVDTLTLKYGGEDFKNQINTYGFKNDPAFLRFISNLNNILTEDKAITPNQAVTGTGGETSYEKTAEKFFPQEKPT